MKNSKQKFVWLVDSGAYSDYHVVGIYDSEEAASKVIDELKLDAECTRMPLNPAYHELCNGLKIWNIIMAKDGTTENVEIRETLGYYYSSIDPELRVAEREYYTNEKERLPNAIAGTVWAKDAEHAIKITNEVRIQKIASGELK